MKKRIPNITDVWIRFGVELISTPIDPTENIWVLMSLLMTSSKWKVLDSRKAI